MRVKSRWLQGSWVVLNHQFKMPYLCTNCGMFLKLTIESWYLRSNLQEKLLCSSKLMVVDKVPKSALKEGQLLAVHWDARTRQNGRHTRVWHGDTRATPLPAHQCRILFFFFVSQLAPTQRKLGPICSELGRFALTRGISVRIANSGRNSKKKKKVVKRTVSRLTLSDSFLSHISAQLLLLLSLYVPPAPLLHHLITDKFCF